MKVITENHIRMAILNGELSPGEQVVVDTTTLITPAAVSYMREKRIVSSVDAENSNMEKKITKYSEKPNKTNIVLENKYEILKNLLEILSELGKLDSNAFFEFKHKCWNLLNKMYTRLLSVDTYENKEKINISDNKVVELLSDEIDVFFPSFSDKNDIVLCSVFYKLIFFYNFLIINGDDFSLIDDIFRLIYLTYEKINAEG